MEGIRMRIAAVRVDPNLDRNHYARLLAYISPEKRNRLPRFRQDNDFNLGLIAEILVRTMLGEELGIANEQIRIEADPNGKPRLEGMPDYHFNLTHSGQWVACVTDREQTGIDIERVIELGGDIAGRFFTHKECEYLNRLSGEMRTRAFFQLWTLKESYMKADGKGMRIGLDTFGFVLDYANEEPVITLETKLPLNNCSFRLYECCPGYELAVCAMHDRFPAEPEVMSDKELVRRFEALLDSSTMPTSSQSC